MADSRIVVLIPESTRKERGGDPPGPRSAGILDALPSDARAALESLRQTVSAESPAGSVAAAGLLPAYQRFRGNMYRHIPREAWEDRAPGVEVLIVSGLLGLVASRDEIPGYSHSMAESLPPFGKVNRWWHGHGLPAILSAYLRAVQPATVVDLLSLEYREAVAGYAGDVAGIVVKTIDFPGLGRASQPRRGEAVAEILRSGKV